MRRSTMDGINFGVIHNLLELIGILVARTSRIRMGIY